MLPLSSREGDMEGRLCKHVYDKSSCFLLVYLQVALPHFSGKAIGSHRGCYQEATFQRKLGDRNWAREKGLFTPLVRTRERKILSLTCFPASKLQFYRKDETTARKHVDADLVVRQFIRMVWISSGSLDLPEQPELLLILIYSLPRISSGN